MKEISVTEMILVIFCQDIYSFSTDFVLLCNRAVRYDDISRMDEIKSLSFHIMFYRLYIVVSQNTLFSVIHFHEQLVSKRRTTTVAWSRVFKHCSFKTTDFKPLKHKQQSYMCAPSLSV